MTMGPLLLTITLTFIAINLKDKNLFGKKANKLIKKVSVDYTSIKVKSLYQKLENITALKHQMVVRLLKLGAV